jgi:hypothetical protein
VRRLPLLSVIHYQNSRGQPVYLPIEPADPLIEALRYGIEKDLPVYLVDQDVDHYERHYDSLPDAYAVKRLGHDRYCTACQTVLAAAEVDPQDLNREAVMAYHLRKLKEKYQRILFVCGLAHEQRIKERLTHPGESEPIRKIKREGVVIYHLAAESSREIMAELPYLSLVFERARNSGAPALDAIDRLEQQVQLAQRARHLHAKNNGEHVSASTIRTLFRFARNYALVEGRLAPDFFQLLVAARGAINDNYAYELWDLATNWPFQIESPEIPAIHLSMSDLFEHTRYFRFHRQLKTRRRNMLRLVKLRAKEKSPGEWKESWKGDAICSYQPEDIVVESYGDFLKKKAKGILSAEHVRVEPFTASLLDGIDIRETLRNWHEGRLYVQERQLVRGEVGAVIVIFDEDMNPQPAYPWCMTWQGEHEQESDMAFYSTPIGEQLVGPGISRCQYGGFLLTAEPGRMFNVFEDPLFDRAESKPERLILAAIDYSTHPLIVYAGPRPPRSIFYSLAQKYGKRLVFVPLGDLSPVTLRQIRVFHVLDGHPVREYAKNYI